MEFYSVIKNNEIMQFATTWKNMDMIKLNELSQRNTNILSLICRILKKLLQMNLFTKQKEIHRLRKCIWLPVGKNEVWGGEDRLGIWDGHVHNAIVKIETNKDLLYCTGNTIL